MTLHELLHTCWGQAKRSPDYDKESWTQLQGAIIELEEVETCLLAAAYRASRTVDLLEHLDLLSGDGELGSVAVVLRPIDVPSADGTSAPSNNALP